MRQLLLPVCPLLLLAAPAAAQDPPFHASLRDNFEQPGRSYSDVWGYGNQAYIGRFGDNEFDILDVSNPDNIFLTRNVSIPSPNNGCSAQDIKVGPSAFNPSTTLGFVSFESSGPDAVGIYDFTTPSSPTLLTTLQPDFSLYQTSHNTSYRDDGWLVVANSFSSSVAIIDLRNYNPASAPSSINSATYLISNIGSGFVHDITITDDYLFMAEWDSLQVWDASNLGSGPPSFLGEVRGYSCHAVWASDDGAYVVTTDERSGGSLRLWTMDDNGSSVTLRQTDSFVARQDSGVGQAYSAHNPVMLGDRIYTSYYGSGVVVHEIDRTDDSFDIVARYDTSTFGASGFDGCWGVYPLFGHDNVIASDQEEGLFTIDFSAIDIRSASARPTIVTPFEATTVQVEIEVIGTRTLDASSPLLHTSVDNGAYTTTAMSLVGGNLWEADLPALGCGSKVDYYFSADDTTGETYTRPTNTPVRTYTAYSALSTTTVFSDNFNSNKGWSVSNSGISAGGWERGAPVETGFQPGYDDDADSGNSCYITDNGFPGGSTSDNDVDGGPTRLTSPVLDFSDGDGLISFTGWQACNDPDDQDGLVVEVSNNGGSSWSPVFNIIRKSGGWIRYSFRVSDHVSPTGNVRVRFSIADNPNDSLTEGGVDNFVAETFCSSPAALATFRNGGGSNTACFTTEAPVLGETWTSTIDHSSRPGATFTMMVLFQSGSSGTFGPGGEFLVNLASIRFFQSLIPSTGTSDVHAYPIPADVSFAGRTTTAQGAILGAPGGYSLCNAYDLSVGF